MRKYVCDSQGSEPNPDHKYGHDDADGDLLHPPVMVHLARHAALVSFPGKLALTLLLRGHRCGPPAIPQSAAVCVVWQMRCLADLQVRGQPRMRNFANRTVAVGLVVPRRYLSCPNW
jgi:hypothetical protein